VTKPYFDEPRPRVFAHRGLAVATEHSLGAPENTLLSFAAAIGAGATYIETDVNASSDGVSVVSHDPSLERIAGLPGQVREHTMAQLRRIPLGHDQSFSSLAEVLDVFPDVRFNIDIKSDDAVAPTIAAIRAARAVDRVLVTSFSERRRRAAVAGLPGVATSVGASRFAVALAAGRIGATPLLRRALAGVDCVQVPMRHGPIAITVPTFIDRLHDAGVEIHVWTINDAQTMHELLALGVDGLVSDRVDVALQVVSGLR